MIKMMTVTVALGLASLATTSNTVQAQGSALSTNLRGEYTCFRAPNDSIPGCVFHPVPADVASLGRMLKFDTEDFSQVQFTNKSMVAQLLAPHGGWAYGTCWVGGDATVQVQELKSEGGDGGAYVSAKLQSVASKTAPSLLSKERQPYNCKLGNATGPSVAGGRFKGTADLLAIARRIPIPEITLGGDCSCTITKNMIEIDASDQIFLYQDSVGPAVVVYYSENNSGDPNSKFYRFTGSAWTDVGHEVMPGYTGKADDYFQATAVGITKFRGQGVAPLKYVFHDGKFVQTR